ncbi:MAG: transglutaminase family protein [Bosea sp. (in: a-proteobacteria)]
MIYDIRHLTTYSYQSPVPMARCMLRMLPRHDDGQRVLSARLEVMPEPAQRQDAVCFFGNRTTMLIIEKPHKLLKLELRARVDVRRQAAPFAALTPRWEEVRASASALPGLDAQAPAHFLFPSRLVRASAAITDFARAAFWPDRPVLEGALDLMARIHGSFTYDPEATAVSTPLEQAFAERRGVCQDFAHVMIAGLRGLGLPAAYVSGFIRTIPPEGEARLAGADATHAWVSLWCGAEFGWIGLDPTNNMTIGDDHIVVANGRDYADVAPLDGVIVGPGQQKLKVEVDVIPVS